MRRCRSRPDRYRPRNQQVIVPARARCAERGFASANCRQALLVVRIRPASSSTRASRAGRASMIDWANRAVGGGGSASSMDRVDGCMGVLGGRRRGHERPRHAADRMFPAADGPSRRSGDPTRTPRSREARRFSSAEPHLPVMAATHSALSMYFDTRFFISALWLCANVCSPDAWRS